MLKGIAKRIGVVSLTALMIGNIAIQTTFAESSVTDNAKKPINTEMSRFGKITQKPFEKGEIIVKYKNGKNSESTQVKIKNKIMNDLSKNKSFSPKRKKIIAENTELVSVDQNEDIKSITAELAKDPDIEYAQPNYIYTADYIPSDAKFSDQWGCKNPVTGVDINTSSAWDVSKGSSSVVVGVIDSEIAITHPDLQANIYVNPNEIADGQDNDGNNKPDDINGWNFVKNNNNVFTKEGQVHGSHVAGTIAAVANTQGVIGVAPNVKIMPLVSLDSEGKGSTSTIVEAINYAASKGVKILNLSLGYESSADTAADDQMFTNAILSNSQILFVCAAGNSSANLDVNPHFPACVNASNVLTVASIESNGSLSRFSNFGSAVDVAAPGSDIMSTTYSLDSNSMPVYDYRFLSGTSMATPHVAGVAALVKSVFPSASVTDIINRIKAKAAVDGELSGRVTGGLVVDANNSLRNINSLSVTKSIPNDTSLYLEWSAVTGATTYKVQVGYGISFYVGTLKCNLSSLTPDSGYTVKISALDSASNVLAETRFMRRTLRAGTGTGLKGTYFNDTTMSTQKVQKVGNVNFDWGSGSPDASINNQTFSALYQGEIEPKYSEEYTIYAQTLGAARVWLDGSLLFDRTVDNTDTTTELSANVTLKANQHYPIQIEYYESYSNASLKLLWSSASQSKQIVPADRLYLSSLQSGIWSMKGNATKDTTFNMSFAAVEGNTLYNLVAPLTTYGWLESYDEATGTFTKLVNLPKTFGNYNLPRLYNALVPLNGKLYIFNSGIFADDNLPYVFVLEYNIATGTFSEKAMFQYDMTTAKVINGNIYVFGGQGNPDVRLYNPVNNSFTTVAQLPGILSSYSVSSLGDSLYLTGGQLYQNPPVNGYSLTNVNTVYALNTLNYTWSTKMSLPNPVSLHSSVVKNGRLYVFGGSEGVPGQDTVHGYMYTPETDTWTDAPNLITDRECFGLEILNNKVFAIYGVQGSASGSYNYFDVLEDRYATTYKISGYIKPDVTSSNTQIKSGFNVELNGFGKYATTDQNGYFEITGVPSNVDGYTLKISKSQYMTRLVNNVKVKASNLQVSTQTAPIDIWAGDIVVNNAIDSADAAKVNSCMGTVLGNANYDALCDLNLDNKITADDLTALNKHIGTTTSSYPNLF